MWSEKKYIIFDLDGTLIDSMGIWNKVDSKLIEELGSDPPDEMTIQRNRDNFLQNNLDASDIYLRYCDYIGKRYRSKLSTAAIYQKRNELANSLFETDLVFKKGAEELILYLHSCNYKLILATTSGIQQIRKYRTICKRIDFSYIDLYFFGIFTKDDTTRLKPDPAIHHLILNKYNAQPCECLVIEDSLSGVYAAKAAQIEVVAMMDRYSEFNVEKIKKESDYYFESFPDLLSFWKDG